MFKLEPPPEAARPRSVFSAIDQQAVHREFAGMPVPSSPEDKPVLVPTSPSSVPSSPVSAVAPVRNFPKVGRNDPCPCGSGKKFKKCCGQ